MEACENFVDSGSQIFNKKTIILIDEREILVYTIHERRTRSLLWVILPVKNGVWLSGAPQDTAGCGLILSRREFAEAVPWGFYLAAAWVQESRTARRRVRKRFEAARQKFVRDCAPPGTRHLYKI